MERLAGGKADVNLRRFLEGLSFPALKHDVVHTARKNGAPNDVVSVLEQLPVNEFASAEQVIAEYPRLA